MSLRKLEEQPEWLKGGTLRDYQLEGLNFLMNRSAATMHCREVLLTCNIIRPAAMSFGLAHDNSDFCHEQY